MNKTYSINLVGSVFTIEETAFEQLKSYIDILKRHFSKFEDGDEIVRDIETRIAEKFQQMLQKSQRQVIELQDIETIRQEMGMPQEFDLDTDHTDDSHLFEPKSTTDSQKILENTNVLEPQRLYQITDDKVVAGVCRGLAGYLGLDPVLVRVVFAALVFLGGFTFVAYLVLAVAMPKKTWAASGYSHLPKRSRLYRNADGRILGGISSGLGAYFGLDASVVRVLFVFATIFGGFGLIAYIILWFSMPLAETLIEKIEMKGNQANIEQISAAKQAVLMHSSRPQALGIVGELIENSIRAIGPLLRLFLGIVCLLISIPWVLLVFMSLGLLIGVSSNSHFSPIPLHNFMGNNTSNFLAYIILFWLIFAPTLYLLYVGIRLIFRRSIINANGLLGLFASWLCCIFVSFTMGTYIATDFAQENEVIETKTFLMPKNNRLLQINLPDYKANRYRNLNIIIKSKNGLGNEIIVKKIKKSRGPNDQMAQQYAQMFDFEVDLRDSILQLGREMKFINQAIFRNQSITLEIFIPKDTQLKLNNNAFYDIENPKIYYQHQDEDNNSDQNEHNTLDQKIYQLKQDSLVCINAKQLKLKINND